MERIVRAMESYAQQFQSPAPLSAATELRLCGDVSREEIERLSEDYAESVISEDATATYTAAQAYHHVKKAYKMALLSQRQPVAPEREEEIAIAAARYGFTYAGQVKHQGDIPDGNILQWLKWYRKSASPSAENKSSHTEGDWII